MFSLPAKGSSATAVLNQLKELQHDDADWQNGRTFSLVFDPGKEALELAKAAYSQYFSTNALNLSVFPSLRKMEQECVAMTAGLLNGDEKTAGNITSGGTESILLAVKAARDHAAKKYSISNPECVLPISAHPAFDKAGKYFGVKMVYAPVDENYQVDLAAMAEAINDNTVLLVGSAVQYAQGVIDPIEGIAALAKQHKLLCHVDGCIGGFMLPFAEALGADVTPWDFRVDGVTSISCDLHKYAYSAKGTSVILYNSAKLRRSQFHVYTDWPGGIYASPTMAGTRPGGAIAAAWAVMNYLGYDGYLDMAKRVMASTEIIADGVNDIAELEILGKPPMSLLAFSSKRLNVYAIADELQSRGWHLDRHQNPNALHLTVSQGHVGKEQEFLDDLEASVAAVRKISFRQMGDSAKIAVTNTLAKSLPDKLFGTISRAANKIGGDAVPKRSAALYGMIASLPARGELAELVLDALDKLNSLPSDKSGNKSRKDG